VLQLPRSLEQVARFHRRALYGFALLLSITIVGATVVFMDSALTSFFKTKENGFIRSREHVEAEVVRLSSRLMSMVDLYEGNWTFHKQENIPIDHYQDLLRRQNGIAVTDSDLTATPFLLVASARGIDNKEQLSMMLHIVRHMSAAPSFDVRRGITVSGYIYAADLSFVAAAPVAPRFGSPTDVTEGPKAYIHSRVEPIEVMLRQKPANELLAHRPIWLSVDDSRQRRVLAEIVLPIFHERERMAVIVAKIPADQFLEYFIEPAPPDGFFVLGGDNSQSLGASPQSARNTRLLKVIREHAPEFPQAPRSRALIRAGLTFIYAQRIDGAGWIAAYAFDWKDVLNGISGEVIAAILLCVGALGLLWVGVAYFDRRIAKPFVRDARKLIEAEQFTRSIIDTAPVGIAVFDPARNLLIIENDVAKHLLGKTSPGNNNIVFYRTATAQRSDTPLCPGNDKSGGHAFSEIPWKSEHGSMYIGVASSSTRFHGHDAVLFGLVDITERKTSEAMLINARRAADQANQQKSMFLAMASHEIRTPLHGATGHLELLERSRLDNEQRERVEIIRRSFSALSSLISDLLDTTRIEAKTLAIDARPIYVNSIVEHCAQQFAPTILTKHISLQCYTDPALDCLLEGDDHRLMQILQNLVSNAAKFTRHGEISLSTRLLRFEDTLTWIRIEVTDTGVGIPSALQAMVFKPLTQADASISRRFGGTGLGLFLCRNLAELMGGRVTLRSEPNVGSTFTVDIPLRHVGRDDGVNAPLRGVSIRVVSGEKRLSAMWRERLARWGATIHDTDRSDQADLQILDGTSLSSPFEIAYQELGNRSSKSICVTPLGPLAPTRHKNVSHVSLYSSEALLAALLDATENRTPQADSFVAAREDIVPLNVLVVEDDPVHQVLIEHQLQVLGYPSVRVATDGREGLKMWIEAAADLVMTDIGMPYLDGIGLLNEIRKRSPEAFIVAISASGSGDGNCGESSGFSMVLNKPVLLEQLRTVIRSACRNRLTRGVVHPAPSTGTLSPVKRLPTMLRDAFQQSWPDECESIRQAIKNHHEIRARRRLHRLQGALLSMGLDAYATDCVALQMLCTRDCNWDEFDIQFSRLATNLSDVFWKSKPD
jgi:two-component system, NarL family, capsular synthesis sensor histidine kinase RcsC